MTEHEIVAAMDAFGGSFARALAAAWRMADPDNQRRLKEAFPDLWAEYAELAERQRVRAGKS
jgi:hypothetical protein